ncbi:glycosyltransferase [Sphingomonas glacialis]|uniref:Glycosyltransferase n=1 Tax=Sphingomonas glacialis TaxID=658225 RepID=A0A502FQD0_9SPHN|nr:glycosyltransferase [Sphingomonas glacialis]TPG51624.1 glycosyltransferase [Sphingomonas glacialis]
MRIVIDYQGVQTDSRYRGIGRYAASLVKAMVRREPEHDYIIVLNGRFSAGIEAIRADLDSVLPQSQIRVWHTPGPVQASAPQGRDLREIAEVLREHYIRALEPDVVLITSLFEGFDDEAVISVRKSTPEVPTAAIFYDLTPVFLPDAPYREDPVRRSWYRDRIENLNRCDLLLAISESSKTEVVHELGRDASSVVNIFAAHSDAFVAKAFSDTEKDDVRRRFGLTKPFILFVGGLEPNKNLQGLVEGLSYLPATLRSQYHFVCVGRRNAGEVDAILNLAPDPSVREMMSIVGHVADQELVDLYNACALFVCPSLREGFGLPALEAMACGAPTIVSNATSLPEIVANPDAVFDPTSPRAIAAKMTEVLTNPALQSRLAGAGATRAAQLTWDDCAKEALAALEALKTQRPLDQSRRASVVTTGIFRPNTISILMQKLDHHGDFILGLPAMAKLRARYPDARIDAVIGSWNKDAAEASGLFDNIYILDFFKIKSSDRAQFRSDLLNITDDMPYYDFAIDLRRQDDTRFILLKFNALKYFGYKTGKAVIDNLLTSGLEIYPEKAGERRYFEETHVSEQILRIVDALPFDPNDYVQLPKLGVSVPQRPGAVAIFPRVGLDARQWDSDRFRQLIERLAASPLITEINVYAGKAEELEPIQVPHHKKINLGCGLKFADLHTSLSGNQVCVGNNSFGVHLASYVGCRTIGIYSGHELPQQWGAGFNDAKAIMIDAACAPCHLPDRKSCPFDVFCLEDISVNAVFDLVLADVAGKTDTIYRSEITARNPASAVPALINEINKLKTMHTLGTVLPEHKVALAAAIARNFPERMRQGASMYVDVSNFRRDVDVLDPKTQFEWEAVSDLIRTLRRSLPAGHTVVPIAADRHDTDFYEQPFESIEEMSASTRNAPVVVPFAGDIYLGVESYLFRSQPQWDLIYSWRSQGVFTAFLLPEHELEMWGAAAPDDERAVLFETFLRQATHFDEIIMAGAPRPLVEAWVRENAPPRERPLSIQRVDPIEGSIAAQPPRNALAAGAVVRLADILTARSSPRSNRRASANVAAVAN